MYIYAYYHAIVYIPLLAWTEGCAQALLAKAEGQLRDVEAQATAAQAAQERAERTGQEGPRACYSL